jgi:hypothetical protein
MTNLHAKYEDCGSKESQVIGQTSFYLVNAPVTLTFDPMTPKSIGVIY